jgi:hypothetical protein
LKKGLSYTEEELEKQHFPKQKDRIQFNSLLFMCRVYSFKANYRHNNNDTIKIIVLFIYVLNSTIQRLITESAQIENNESKHYNKTKQLISISKNNKFNKNNNIRLEGTSYEVSPCADSVDLRQSTTLSSR